MVLELCVFFLMFCVFVWGLYVCVFVCEACVCGCICGVFHAFVCFIFVCFFIFAFFKICMFDGIVPTFAALPYISCQACVDVCCECVYVVQGPPMATAKSCSIFRTIAQKKSGVCMTIVFVFLVQTLLFEKIQFFFTNFCLTFCMFLVHVFSFFPKIKKIQKKMFLFDHT